MKEEIEMEKLMGYVKEMEKEGINICRPQFQQYDMVEMVLISKSYGLIKRLIENDKIDFDKLKPLTGVTEIMLATNYPNGIEVKKRYRLYEQLIMLLSISDTPGDDLISYLK